MSDWTYDGLWAKTRAYSQRASHEDTDGPLFPLWSTLSLEFLARSSLAYIHPALLADPREGENVLHAFGYEIESTPRSIPDWYAVAGKSETEAGNSSCECVIESRCNRIRPLWLLVTDRFGRTVGKPDLSRAVGRPDRGLGPCAAHHQGRMGSHPRFATLL